MPISTQLLVWVCYLTPFWHWMPAVGMHLLQFVDCLFVQAFGRNIWTDDEFFDELMKVRVSALMDDLLTFRILRDEVGFDPGAPNFALASFVMWLVEYIFPQAAMMLQWEVAFAVWAIDPDWYSAHIDQIDVIFPRQRGFFTTAHVKMISVEFMRKRRLKLPLEIAHPAMTVRALLHIWYTGVFAVTLPVARRRSRSHPLWVWDSKSVQPQTRSPKAWLLYEVMGRGMFLLVFFGLVKKSFKWLPEYFRKRTADENWIRLIGPKPPVMAENTKEGVQ